MPMHDWTRVKAGVYHNFHVLWMSALTNRFNAGVLPSGYFAMTEQILGGPEPDVVTLQARTRPPAGANGGVAVAPIRPRAQFVMPIDPERRRYARKANRIAVRHDAGDVVAVVEIVSPGNIDRPGSVQAFADKAVALLDRQVNLLVVDPFPPGPHDVNGIHGAIWAELMGEVFELPQGKPLTFAAYQAEPMTAHVETLAVGDRLPDMPLFLDGELGVDVPLEETYRATWDQLPAELRAMLDR